MKKQTQFFNNKNKKDSSKYDLADVRSAAAKSMTKAKKRTVAETTEEEDLLEGLSDEVVVPTDLAKTTKLVFFRKYDTYPPCSVTSQNTPPASSEKRQPGILPPTREMRGRSAVFMSSAVAAFCRQ